jgi:hypothetical protein
MITADDKALKWLSGAMDHFTKECRAQIDQGRERAKSTGPVHVGGKPSPSMAIIIEDRSDTDDPEPLVEWSTSAARGRGPQGQRQSG